MNIINIKININDLNEFIRLTNSFESDLDLINGHYIIDAKSLLGVYGLDISKTYQLKIYSKSDIELKKFNESFKIFKA